MAEMRRPSVPFRFQRQSIPVTKFHGGESVLLMNVGSYGYWRESLFTVHGRSVPVLAIACYMAYASVVTAGSLLLSPLLVTGTHDATAVEHILAGEDEQYFQIHEWIIELLGTVLFFMLVFRTQLSYDRWWEGRTIWGMITYTTRDVSRQAVNYVKSPEHVARICRWAIAFPAAMKAHLRFERELPELADVLLPAELMALLASDHLVIYANEQLGHAVASARDAGHLSDYLLVMMDQNLQKLSATLGKCERILTTKMPFPYIVHLRTFLILWLLMLPFTMIKFFGWYALVGDLMIFYLFVSFEFISVQIEQPFGKEFNDLPLDKYVTGVIKPNILAMLARSTGGAASAVVSDIGTSPVQPSPVQQKLPLVFAAQAKRAKAPGQTKGIFAMKSRFNYYASGV
ncbi:Bestrophin, RFP-TM, chloride channel-domain-containing protein [Pavlovales sp. CCMP2436]|nr:Bestrophin, RFP-TM, chloride channel-domain-containing protein [Pavlovales sp. CCMP2436]